jgi:transposase InsO family protein
MGISMPWQERSIMKQREEFVRLALMPGTNMSELCRRFEISRNNGYKWLARYAAEGQAGLAERSRRPKHSPMRTQPAIAAEVLRIRAESNGAWGGRKIARVMRNEGFAPVPAQSTITEILRRHGQLVHRAAEHPGPHQRFERAEPNELWQMDYKGHFPIGGGRCHPLTVLDDHARYSLGLEACGDEQGSTVRARLTNVFRRYGMPFSMLMDNGSPWSDHGPYTKLTVWLIQLGIKVIHGRPYHPQTQGKEERFHRTLQAEVLDRGSFVDLADCQRAFDKWRHVYNHLRPHQALDLDVPATRYRVSPRSFPERLPEIQYGPDDLVRKVDQDGYFAFKGRHFRLSKAFSRQPIALRPTTKDGNFSVHFCVQQIATLDLRADSNACGLVDNAKTRCPQGPQAQQRQQNQIQV